MTHLKISDQRSRNWATLLYPESGSLDDLLTALRGLKYAVSPLHDMDADEEGELKKPHYHAVFAFDGLKSRRQVSEVIPDCCVGLERISSLTGYVRYLVHLDDPDKYQYPPGDIISSRLDVQSILSDGGTVTLADVLGQVRSLHLTRFRDVVNWALDCQPGYLPIIAKYSYFFNTFLRGDDARD